MTVVFINHLRHLFLGDYALYAAYTCPYSHIYSPPLMGMYLLQNGNSYH